MLPALGAVSSVIDALQSLTSKRSSSAGRSPANPFDVSGGAPTSAGAASTQPASGFSPISPQTMSALIAAQGDTTNTARTDPSGEALSGASSTSVSNSDGSTTTSITYADGSKVSLTTPAASTPSTKSATSSYNLIEQLIQRQAQALSASVASSLSVSV